MGRIWMVQWRQNLQVLQQLRVIMIGAQALAIDLLYQTHAGLNGGQRQFTDAVGAQHFVHAITVDHANATLAVAQFELY
jgi:hypothetical protein